MGWLRLSMWVPHRSGNSKIFWKLTCERLLG
jgi:hypothetical protein